jgi:hypothetical protein
MNPGPPPAFLLRTGAGEPPSVEAPAAVDDVALETSEDRAMFLDPAELDGALAEIRDAEPSALPALWRKLIDQLSQVLPGMPSPQAPQALDDAARRLAALVERAPDLAIFLAVHADPSQAAPYSVQRGTHAATTALLVALRSGWSPQRSLTLVKAALTMNLGMLDLQERLSNQARLASPAQRQAIHAHPLTSAQILKDSGVADAEWLDAVAQHHEIPGGHGYPAALTVVSDMANALRTADLYTAKLEGRSGRDALPPDRALRDLQLAERGNPFAAALAAEFGPWPPGSIVRLHSGEVAVVVRRTAEPLAPRVAKLTSRRAEPLAEPVECEASGLAHGIAAPVNPHAVKVRVDADRLFAHAHD